MDNKQGKDVETGKSLLTKSGEAEFEEAISATKFGKFNIFLILAAIPAAWSSVFETTTMSYVFPAAQCDLNLSLEDKGLLNAISYIGMISSAFIWGYLCDTLGRKKLLSMGYFLDALFVIISSFSQTFTVLMLSKFLGGFIINGPFAALTCYTLEFHGTKYRGSIQMIMGIIISTGAIFLPLLAILILPANINFTLFDYLEIHSWNVYLFVTAFAPLLAGCIYLFLPESPKFLMTSGRNEEALKVFQMVYSMNTGNSPSTYPIKRLVDERKGNITEMNGKPKEEIKSSKQALLNGWKQIKPLFLPPLLQKLLLVCGLQMLFMMSLNTLRLWLPQLFQAINDYEYYNNGTSADLCTMLEQIRPKNVSISVECVVNTDNVKVYINAIIVASVTILGYIAAGYLIIILGKKKLLVILGLTTGISGFCLYFAKSTNMTLFLASIYTMMGSININVLLTVVVDLFPTALRTMTVSLTLMMGRIGPMIGNIIFPLLLNAGCAPPFFTVGTVMLCCAIFCLFLPNTDMKALR